jgi:amino acid permease
MTKMAVLATIVVLANLAVAAIHGQAHVALGVGLDDWQTAFVRIVVLAAPIVSVVLYWTPLRDWGARLLAISMLGALLFGIYYHLIAVSNDHLGHLPEGDARGMFTTTALLLIPVEAVGAAFGFWSAWKFRTRRSTP